MAVNRYDDTRAWYTISTYSGYEDKVADSIKQRLGSPEFEGKIFDAIVPKEKRIEIKNGKRKIVDRKIFQGYVLVEMCLSDETWYIIRNRQRHPAHPDFRKRNPQNQEAYGRRRPQVFRQLRNRRSRLHRGRTVQGL